jgi:aldose 1-epimerase
METYTLANTRGVEIRFIPLGGRIVSIRLPDRRGDVVDVTPGYDSVDQYAADTRYFGALIGRYANRIARGRFTLDGVEYRLPINDDPNHLHGGPNGFHARSWRVEPFARSGVRGAVLDLHSAAGDDGYPAALAVNVAYSLDDESRFRIEYHATANAPTVLNLTQHVFFNLAGESAGDIRDHELTIAASHFTPVDETLIPTGELRGVAGTPFDFAASKRIGADLGAPDDQLRISGGYDHNYVLRQPAPGLPAFAARLADPRSGRVLELHTTEPGLQVYTGNRLDRGPPGKGGRSYAPYAAVALETQHFPDSPNHPGFPPTVLRPGQEFTSTTTYRFSVG